MLGPAREHVGLVADDLVRVVPGVVAVHGEPAPVGRSMRVRSEGGGEHQGAVVALALLALGHPVVVVLPHPVDVGGVGRAERRVAVDVGRDEGPGRPHDPVAASPARRPDRDHVPRADHRAR